MAFERTLRTVLLVEARNRTQAALDQATHGLTNFAHRIESIGSVAQDASTKYERAFATVEQLNDQAQASTERVKRAENDLKTARENLSRVSTDEARKAVGGLERQQAALDEVRRATAKYGGASEQAAKDAALLASAEHQEKINKQTIGVRLGKQAMQGLGIAALAATAAIGEFAKNSIEVGVKYQETTTKIANSANISTEAAQKIGDAFLSTAGQSTFGADEMASAYGKVAGQLGLTEGHALSAKDALEFMRQATDTAEASGTSLGSTTGTLSKLMQAYHIDVKDVGSVSDVLYNASRLTGQNFGALGNVMTRMKGQLGAMAPSIQDTSTLMVDMAAHGLTGRQQMGALNAAFNGLLKTTSKTVPTVQETKSALKALPEPLRSLAKEYAHGQISASDYTKKLKDLPQAMQTYGKSFKSIADKSKQDANVMNSLNFTPAQQQMSKLGVHVFDSTGKFVGFRSVLSELSPKINELHGKQAKLTALQPIFGSNSKKMLGIIEGGTKAWDKYSKAINDHKSREEAAKRAQETYEGTMKKFHATIKDVQITLGNALMPAVMGLMHAFQKVLTPVINFIQHNKKLVGVLGGVLLGVTGLTGGIYGMIKVSHGVSKVFDTIGESIGKAALKQKAFTVATKAQMVVQKAQAAATKIAAAAQWLFNAAMSANPIVLIIIAIAALVGMFILLYHHSKAVRDIVATVGHAFKIAFSAVVKAVKAAFDWIKKNWPLLVEILMGPVGWAIAIWTHFHKQIIEIFKKVLNFIKDVWGKIVTFASNAFDSVVGFFKDLPGKAAKALGDFVSTVWSKIVIGATWIYDHIEKPILDFFGGLPAKIATAATGMWDGISQAFKGAINWIIDHWNNFGFTLPKIHIPWVGTFGGQTVHTPQIPEWKAAGGPVHPGRSYIVGERGPELVSFGASANVLSNYKTTDLLAGSNKGGSTVVVNVHMQGHVYGSLDHLAKELGGHLAKNMLPNGGVLLR